jgi:hypothetical protein
MSRKNFLVKSWGNPCYLLPAAMQQTDRIKELSLQKNIENLEMRH